MAHGGGPRTAPAHLPRPGGGRQPDRARGRDRPGARGPVPRARLHDLHGRDRQHRRRVPRTREGTILVSTHMDTAGTDRGIVPIIGDDGVIRTDGSTILGADDKSGLAGCLELLTLLQQNPGTLAPDDRARRLGRRGERPGRLATDGRQPAERHARLRARHRRCHGLDHLLVADVGVPDRHLPRPQGARRGRAREGRQRHPGRGRRDRRDDRWGGSTTRRWPTSAPSRWRGAQRHPRHRGAPGHGAQPRPGQARRAARRDAAGLRGGRGGTRRHGRVRGRGDLPHLQDRRGRPALPGGRGRDPLARARGGRRASPAAAPTATTSTPRASRASRCRPAWSTSTPRRSTSPSTTSCWRRRSSSRSPRCRRRKRS